MWNMEDARPKFMRELYTQKYVQRAESMFKKVGGGKFTLFEVLEELIRIGDYKGSNIADMLHKRLNKVTIGRIKSVLLNNVPQLLRFKTKESDLVLIAEYARIRLEILKKTLLKIANNIHGDSALQGNL